jgi:hypothetical protein
VNLGGEPERDDSGLPPVDIEIPDDARELDRDVQAYRRELRARRRRERRMRLHAPLTRDGVVLPLLASCLVLALIAGTLLTVFTAGPNGEGNLPAAARTPHAAASHSLSSSRSGSPAAGANSSVAAPRDSPTASPSKHKLPDEPIVSAGQRFLLTSLVNRNSLVIALVPAKCACVATVQHLAGQVLRAGLRMYLVSARGQLSAVQPLQRKVGKAIIIAEDVSGALYSDYAGHGLTALLVHPGGSVGTVALSGQTFTLTTQLARLSQEADSAQTSSPTTTTSPR